MLIRLTLICEVLTLYSWQMRSNYPKDAADELSSSDSALAGRHSGDIGQRM